MKVIITDGEQTLVDSTNYDLSFHGAIQEILVGKNIIAQPFADYSSEDISDHCPASDLIESADFKGKSYQQIGDSLSFYERFGRS